MAAGTGGVAGGLVGAMMTRGVEKEMANFYNQEVTAGKILVGAEDHGPQQCRRLASAEAHPLPPGRIRCRWRKVESDSQQSAEAKRKRTSAY